MGSLWVRGGLFFILRFASRLALNGVPLLKIKELMGQGSAETTMRYAHGSQESLCDAIYTIENITSVY